MKQWMETRQVLDRLAGLHRAGTGAALATVIRVRGSAYRHEGAKFIVAADGSTVGNVSGGCLEADVREVALRVLKSGKSELREYCAGSDDVSAWDLGVGCDGSVEVLIVPAADDRAAERELMERDEAFVACSYVAADQPVTRLVVTASSSMGTLGDAHLDAAAIVRARAMLVGGDSSSTVGLRNRDVFFDVMIPPPRLLIVGAGDDARPLAHFAVEVGFRVIVTDRRPGLLDAVRFPARATLIEADAEQLASRTAIDADTYVVVMHHNYADDRESVRTLLGTQAAYIGVLGPRQRTDRILRELASSTTVDESRLYGPGGLDIGTDGAEQVARAVIGEILAVRSGRRPMSLRDRKQPIHAGVTR